MNTLSTAALTLLDEMLSDRVHAQVEAGGGDKPMTEAWTELHNLVLSQATSRW